MTFAQYRERRTNDNLGRFNGTRLPGETPPAKDLRGCRLSETFAAPMPSPTDTKPVVEEEFDMLAFWIQHKSKVLLFTLLLTVGLLVFAIFQYTQYRAREAAARDFASAKTVEDYRKVVASHGSSPVAG